MKKNAIKTIVRIVIGPWFSIWGAMFLLLLAVISELVDLLCPMASLWPETIFSQLHKMTLSLAILGVALALIAWDIVRCHWKNVQLRVVLLIFGCCLWLGTLYGWMRVTERLVPHHKVTMEVVSPDHIRVNGYDLSLGEGGSFNEYLNRRLRQVCYFSRVAIRVVGRNPQLTTSDTFKVILSLPPEMPMERLMDKVLVPCASSEPLYELKGLTFYTAYGIGDWECAQVFKNELPVLPEGSGIHVALGATVEADGQFNHWGYWTDANEVCDFAPDEPPVLGDSPTIRAQYQMPEMVARVDGTIALRINKAVTVARFEQVLSCLHQLGYEKIFVLVDGNRFVSL